MSPPWDVRVWCCPYCYFINHEAAVACVACRTIRVESEKEERVNSVWTCPVCKFTNQYRGTLCFGCGLSVGVFAGAAGTAAPSLPSYYACGDIKPIDVIEDWKLGYRLGNVIKYIARADHKGTALDDLRKARWYLDREIQRREECCGL